MYIEFDDKKFQKCFESEKEASKRLGEKIARKYIQRIILLKSIGDSTELYREHKNVHPHKYDDGRTSIDIDNNFRLLFWVNKNDLDEEYITIDKVCDPHGNDV
jgi:plasmid maintenance system killer protein